MKFFYSTLFIAFLIMGCSKDDTINEIVEEEIVNLPPNNFNIAILNISHEGATINWNEAVDPERDVVTYNVYLNQTFVKNISELTYEFIDLEELTDYSGKIIAKDSNNNQTEVTFSFQTERYYLKYLQKYDYGQYDYGPNGYAYGGPHSMIKSNDQNYIITGASVFPNGNGYRLFALKIDYEGNKIWKKFYDYNLTDGGSPKIINSSTGFVLVSHHHVLSLDNEGNIIWYKKIDSYDIPDSSADIKSVAQNSAGNIFLVGGRGSNVPLLSPSQIGVLTKLNSSGTIIWEKIFDTSYRSFFYDIKIINNNELLILGSVESTDRTFEEISQSNSEQIDFWVLNVNKEGEILWENTFGDGRYDFPREIIAKSNGNYAFAGYSWGAYDISKGRIFEINSDGSEIWNIFTELSSTFSIAETMDGRFITTGHVYGAALGIYKFSSTGVEQWNTKYQESSTYLYGSSVLIEEDGGFRVAGGLRKNYYYGEEKPELLIYKTDPEGNYE